MRRSIAIMWVSVLVPACTLMPPNAEHVRSRQMEDAVLPMATTALESGQMETARRLYLRLLDVDPESVPARMGLGNVSLQERDTAAAARWFLSAATRAEEPEERHAALLAHGRAALADGQLEAAGESFARLIEPTEQAPRTNVAWGHNGIGLTRLLGGDLHGAVASLERAVLLAPEEDRFQGNLNRALAMLGEYSLPEPVDASKTGGQQDDDRPQNLAGSVVPPGSAGTPREPAPRMDEEQTRNGDVSGTLTLDSATDHDSAQSSYRAGEPQNQDAPPPLPTEEPETAKRSTPAEVPPVDPAAAVDSEPPLDGLVEAIAEDTADDLASVEAHDSEPDIVTENPEQTADPLSLPVVQGLTHSQGDSAIDMVADSRPTDELELQPDSGETDPLATPGEQSTAELPAATAPLQSEANRMPSTGAPASHPPVLIVNVNNLSYLQFGAYADLSNAEAVAAPLRSLTDWPVTISDTQDASGAPLHRVRTGPIVTSGALLDLITELETHGYSIANHPPESAGGGVPAATLYNSLQTWLVEEGGERYLQAGAYRERSTAETLAAELRSLTERPVRISEVPRANGPPLNRVRIGPLVPDDPLIELFQTSK